MASRSAFRSDAFLCASLPRGSNRGSPADRPTLISMASNVETSSRMVISKKAFVPPREVHEQITHSMPPQKVELFKSMEDWANDNILIHLKPVEKCWQPQDFLPDPAAETFNDEIKELRERSKEITDDYFVVLVGDMITEEALPTYQTMLNTLDGIRDETGASLTSWAIWTRAWTAEENRHGDLLNKYLYLTGRVDMKQIEKTIQYLIGSGMVHEYLDPFLGNSVWQSWKEKQTAMMKSIAYSTSSSLPAFSLKDWVQGGKRYFIHDRRLEERKRMKKDEIWRWKAPDPLDCCCWVFGPISFIFSYHFKSTYS